MWYTYICIYIYLFFAPKQHKHSQLTNETNACEVTREHGCVTAEGLTRVRITGFKQKALQSPWFLNKLKISVLWGFSTVCAKVQTAEI